jgi:hypothetical protein
VQTLGGLARPVRSKGHRARVAAARLARKRAKAQR